MKQRDIKFAIFRWLGVVFWAALMVFLSRQTGTETTVLSTGIATAIKKVLDLFGISAELNSLHMLLRSFAHVVAYTVLAALLFHALCSRNKNKKAVLISSIWTLALCIIAAVLDEYQKKFINGRHCQWDEAGLNFLGACLGVAVCTLIHKFIRRA